MMSSAISMIAGMEETKVRSASDDLFSSGGEREGVSFATSLNERIGMPASSEGKQAGNDLAIALSSLETATVKKNIEEVAQTPTGGKEEPLADQNASVRNELKCSTPSNIIHTQVAGSGPKLTSENVETNASELPAPVKGDAAYGLPRPTLAPGVPDQTPASNVKIANVDRPVAPNSDSPVAQKEPAAGKKGIESGSLKNSAKTQEKPATNSTVQKIAKKTGDATVVAPKPVAGASTSAIPSAAQVELPKAALPAEITKASDTSSTVVSAVPKPPTGIAPPPNGQFRKEIASGTNASVTDNSMTPPAVSDCAASSKIEMSPQKMTAVALPDRSDGDNKQQVVREPGVAFLHPAGIVSAAVVADDSLGGVAVTKQAVGDAGFHSPASATSSRDQQGIVVGTQSLNEAPRMLSSTPTSLEVGIQNGTHGWLKVRAELTDGGAVNASVSATSSVGQEMLHRELPALAAYLQDEKVTVNAIVVHSAPTGGTDARSSAGTDGAGGQTPQRNNEGEQQHQGLTKTTLNGSDERVSYRGWHGIDEDGSLPLAAYVSGGIWLSVRA
jgi:hypothetical protein